MNYLRSLSFSDSSSLEDLKYYKSYQIGTNMQPTLLFPLLRFESSEYLMYAQQLSLGLYVIKSYNTAALGTGKY